GVFSPPPLFPASTRVEPAAVPPFEVFGRVGRRIPYRDRQHALTRARSGGGSLAGNPVTPLGRRGGRCIRFAARGPGPFSII
ncbi:phenylacetic acid degradation bifunctional protein PaaZ, partial [Klebsiella pneumoniae]|nr:phenylacetic acid degradation bifunctional protein PaaZ [Klebsiella pneumoniae]